MHEATTAPRCRSSSRRDRGRRNLAMCRCAKPPPHHWSNREQSVTAQCASVPMRQTATSPFVEPGRIGDNATRRRAQPLGRHPRRLATSPRRARWATARNGDIANCARSVLADSGPPAVLTERATNQGARGAIREGGREGGRDARLHSNRRSNHHSLSSRTASTECWLARDGPAPDATAVHTRGSATESCKGIMWQELKKGDSSATSSRL